MKKSRIVMIATIIVVLAMLIPSFDNLVTTGHGQSRGSSNTTSGSARDVLTSDVSVSVLAPAISTSLGDSKAIQQFMSFSMSDEHGQPLAGVSVEGLVPNPVENGGGYSMILLGMTNSDGSFVANNMSILQRISSTWSKVIGTLNSSESGPSILVLLTYNDQNGTYLKESSINIFPGQVLEGYSAKLHASFDLNAEPTIHSDPSQLSPQISTDSGPGPLPPPPTTEGSYWVQVRNDIPQDQYGNAIKEQVPVAWEDLQGGAYGLITATGSVSQTCEWHLGIALGAGGFSTSTNLVGGTIWSTNDYWGNTIDKETGGSAYLYMNAYVEGTEFQEYTWSAYMCSRFGLDCGTPTNTYQYDIAALEPDMLSSEQINLYPQTNGLPQDMSYINSNFQYTHYNTYTGEGTSPSSPTTVQITSYDVIGHYSGSSTSTYVNIAMDLGIILALALDWEVALPATIIVGLVGSITTTTTSSFLDYFHCDAPSGYSIQVNVAVGSINYQLPSGSSVPIPLFGVQAIASAPPPPPPPPPPPGGCILSGTNVSVSYGVTVPVQDLMVGEHILSYDPVTEKFFENKVTSINVTNVTSVLNIDNGLLFVSGMHDQPIYVLLPNGMPEWIMVGNLTTSDSILSPLNGTWVPVTSLQMVSGNFTVYEINGQKMFYQSGYMRFTYLANGLLLDRKVG